MRRGRASQTAAMVAFFRAMADEGVRTVPRFSDPTARVLLPRVWRALERGFRWLGRLRARRLARLMDVTALRTLTIDDALREALPCEQVVILGAGLDGRPYRMEELAEARVFEVDHPATQTYKREHAARLRPTARELVYLPVDFEREALGERLAAGGHDAVRKTVWLWEGVIMYLSDAALRATLAAVVERSASGSVLVALYSEPQPSGVRSLLLAFTRLVGEPQIGLRSRETMRAELEQAGLVVESDTGVEDWARAFGAERPIEGARGLRVVVARR